MYAGKELMIYNTFICVSKVQKLNDVESWVSSVATEWTWERSLNSESTDLSNSGLHVTFHKHFSNGTAAIRGSEPLRTDQHYWEIKMTTSVYGTDMVCFACFNALDEWKTHISTLRIYLLLKLSTLSYACAGRIF